MVATPTYLAEDASWAWDFYPRHPSSPFSPTGTSFDVYGFAMQQPIVA